MTDRLGFGCGRLRAGLEERNSRRLIEAALERGIRYFDTAPSYGDGASERVLGLGLREVRRVKNLPFAARAYLDRLANVTGVPVALVSVGPERTAFAA